MRARSAPAVEELSILQVSDPTARERLSKLCRVRTFAANASIISDTQELTEVGFILSGVVRLVKHQKAGEEQIIGLLFPFDMFGRLFHRMPPLGIEAAADTTLCMFDKLALEALIVQHPEIEHNVLMTVFDELDASYELMTILGRSSKTERVAAFLLHVGRRTLQPSAPSTRHSRILAMPISRSDMAACLGTTVETISRATHALERAGAIRIIDPRTFEIRNEALLAEAAGEDPIEEAPCGSSSAGVRERIPVRLR